MIENSTEKLYLLLNACKPKDENVKKRLLILQIVGMPQYKALQAYHGSKKIMQDFFTEDKLQELDSLKLEEIKSCVSILEQTIIGLFDLIQYGDISVLDGMNVPDLYSYDELCELRSRISESKSRDINITNIDEENVWAIFEADTKKHIDEIVEFEKIRDDDLERTILNNLSNGYYCITGQEIKGYREKIYLEKKEKNAEVYRLQIVENKIFVKKLILTIIAGMGVMGATMNSLIAQSYITYVSGAFLAVAFFYWIIG